MKILKLQKQAFLKIVKIYREFMKTTVKPNEHLVKVLKIQYLNPKKNTNIFNVLTIVINIIIFLDKIH